jgi:hypothetical protein
MKKLMCVFALLLVFGAMAIAQTEAEALVTGEVVSALVLVNVDGDWGVFASGNTYVITPAGFKNPPGPGEGAGVVVGPVGFEVDGIGGEDVIVNLVLPGAMNSDDDAAGLPLSNWTYGWNYDNDPGASFAASGAVTGNAVALSINSNAATGLFLGATVTVPPTAFTGTYTAQIIGSAVYTGN